MRSTTALFGVLSFFISLGLADDDLDRLKQKPWHFKDGIGFLDTMQHLGGLNGLASAPAKIQKHPDGMVPAPCLSMANSIREDTGEPWCSPYDLEAYEVVYDDCPDHGIPICRCKTADVSVEEIARDFGRVPVRARQYIKTINARPDGSCGAAAAADHIYLYGPCGGKTTVYLHEVGHALDCAAGLAKSGQGCVSDSKPSWRDIVLEKDTCIPDEYANNVWGDNFAQYSVMAAYHHTVQDVWGAFPAGEIDCMRYGLEEAIGLTRGIFPFSKENTCDRTNWHEREDFVCVGDEAREKGQCEGERKRAHVAEQLSQYDLEVFKADQGHHWGSSHTSTKQGKKVVEFTG